MTSKKETIVTTRLVPLGITAGLFIGLSFVLALYLLLLNAFPYKENIHVSIHPQDVVIGMIIYIKTAIDFALFMGNLISRNEGAKSHIAINSGTALGNGIGTLIILTIWYFFKDIPVLLAGMIILASLVLLTMAEEGVEELETEKNTNLKTAGKVINRLVEDINRIVAPIVRLILPAKTLTAEKLPPGRLFRFALIVPFVLGLDNFAGYIPLFNLVNVFGFSIGVFLAHALLTFFMYLSPKTTTKVVQNPVVVLLGSVVFLGLAVFGFYEAGHILIHLLH